VPVPTVPTRRFQDSALGDAAGADGGAIYLLDQLEHGCFGLRIVASTA
jgi:hypothetical protein